MAQLPINYNFAECLTMSQGNQPESSIEKILIEHIPGAVQLIKAHRSNDRKGTDFWMEMTTGRMLSIDCKVRREDWAMKPKPFFRDDVALENWSVMEKNIVGWARDDRKLTDYIFWLWVDSGRWLLVPFPMLCKVFSLRWEEWFHEYQVATQKTVGRSLEYHSQCIFVPRKVLWSAIIAHFGGTTMQESPNHE